MHNQLHLLVMRRSRSGRAADCNVVGSGESTAGWVGARTGVPARQLEHDYAHDATEERSSQPTAAFLACPSANTQTEQA